MTRKAHLVGAVIGSAGLLASGAPAFADSVQKNVVDLGEDVTSSAPVRVCHDQIAAVGSVAPGLTRADGCVGGAPSARSVETHSGSDGESGSGGANGGDSYAHVEVTLPEASIGQDHEPSSPEHFPPGPVHNPVAPEKPVAPEDESAKLPAAPTPNSVRGHHAVTG